MGFYPSDRSVYDFGMRTSTSHPPEISKEFKRVHDEFRLLAASVDELHNKVEQLLEQLEEKRDGDYENQAMTSEGMRVVQP